MEKGWEFESVVRSIKGVGETEETYRRKGTIREVGEDLEVENVEHPRFRCIKVQEWSLYLSLSHRIRSEISWGDHGVKVGLNRKTKPRVWIKNTQKI